jgi:FUN14 domain-containing protein 1
VDWGRISSRFEKLFYSPPEQPGGAPRPPTVASVWTWFIDFLTADFQQRASFIAGFLLGLRIG